MDNDIAKYTAGGIMVLVGFFYMILGYRFLKLIFFLSGFGFFAFISYSLLSAQLSDVWMDWKVWLLYGICVIIGLVGGFLFLCVTKIGVFIVGACLGVTIAAVSLLSPLMGVLSGGANGSLWVFLYILGFAIALGVLALFLQKYVLVFGTSIYGSYLVFTSIDLLFLHTNFASILSEIVSHFQLPKINNDWKAYFILAGVIVFSIAGIFIQLKKTADGIDHNDKKKKDTSKYQYFKLKQEKKKENLTL